MRTSDFKEAVKLMQKGISFDFVKPEEKDKETKKKQSK